MNLIKFAYHLGSQFSTEEVIHTRGYLSFKFTPKRAKKELQLSPIHFSGLELGLVEQVGSPHT